MGFLPDSTAIPGAVTAFATASPLALVILAGAIAGAVWLVRGASEELRRMAARDWEPRIRTTRRDVADRFAA
jgi:hypothetical protein